ncbi:Rieske 2Fe-2S domain-containing protein [Gryllotalpicola ginsengisoli]|uniref:Rieske 2Fe-2S domain-containing protein n=1 Tax=Gryllotalpicola ginsengisoli TaxID=444608 RepID=UPI0009D6A38E|nr:Rieske (2Fe-2S) protein [Gryllotalpicola ginsengisoli]
MSEPDSRPVAQAGRLTTRVLDTIDGLTALDGVAAKVRGAVQRMLPPGSLRDLLHGVPLGHPAHPLLVQVPLGAWMSAVMADFVPGGERAARALVGVGTAAAVPAAAAGLTDWSEQHAPEQRAGIVHAAANATATVLFAASFLQRSRGGRGRLLALAGLTAAMAGGFIGGHLAYRQASGANHAEDVPYLVPDGWERVGPVAQLPDRTLSRRTVGEVPVLVYRDGERVYALADTCSHLGGPLHEGEIDGELEPCVVCPWHGSTFALRDGAVVHGPATSPQPVFQARVREGWVEVALA